jgi:hypothetical protein
MVPVVNPIIAVSEGDDTRWFVPGFLAHLNNRVFIAIILSRISQLPTL